MQQQRHDSVVFMIRHYLTYAANVMFSECYEDETKCDNGPCILKESLCDGRKDCTDNSDELNCSMSCSFLMGFHHSDSSPRSLSAL